MNDSPALGKLAKDEGKGAMRLVATRHRELPFPVDVRGIWTEKMNGRIPTHGELTHLVSAVLVTLAVTV